MFAGYTIDSITNGVHAATWVAPEFQDLFDRYIPGWRDDNFSLRYALSIPQAEILAAHHSQKKRLIEDVNRQANAGMDFDVLTIGFARRATAYKRPDLLLSVPQAGRERLAHVLRRYRPIRRNHATHDRPERFVLQHPADDAAVCAEGLFLVKSFLLLEKDVHAGIRNLDAYLIERFPSLLVEV